MNSNVPSDLSVPLATDSLPAFQISKINGNLEIYFELDKLEFFFKSCNQLYFNSEQSIRSMVRSSPYFENSVHQAFEYCSLHISKKYFDSFSIEVSLDNYKHIIYSAQKSSIDDKVHCVILGFFDDLTTSARFQSLVRRSTTKPRDNSLTRREAEVLTLIADGNTTKEAAAILNLSFHTVESHKQKLFKKLAVRNTAELGKLAERFGYTNDDKILLRVV